MKPNDIEKFLSETPAPHVRDGLHRAELKRKLLDQIEENGMTTELQTQPSPATNTLRNRKWLWIGGAATALVVTLAIIFMTQPTPIFRNVTHLQVVEGKKAPPEPDNVLHERLDEGRREHGLRRQSLGEIAKDAAVIVVGTPLDSAVAPPNVPGDAPENLIRYQVTRVLKGEWKKKEVTVRTPTAAAEFVGREWILMLSPEFVAGKHQFAATVSIKFEPEIKQSIEKEAK